MDYGKQIIIVRVPGHTGIKGNEIADERASLAINYLDAPVIEQVTTRKAYGTNKLSENQKKKNNKMANPDLKRIKVTVINWLRD